MSDMHATTILGVRRKGQFCLGGDGQVSVGSTILKHNAVKIRVLAKGKVLAGFAGATADAFLLYDLFESILRVHAGNLLKASFEFSKQWRKDRSLRRLDALMIVADLHHTFILSGQGDVIEPEGDVVAIGSGGDYARSAAMALVDHTDMDAQAVVKAGLEIASRICIYTNNTFTFQMITSEESTHV